MMKTKKYRELEQKYRIEKKGLNVVVLKRAEATITSKSYKNQKALPEK